MLGQACDVGDQIEEVLIPPSLGLSKGIDVLGLDIPPIAVLPRANVPKKRLMGIYGFISGVITLIAPQYPS